MRAAGKGEKARLGSKLCLFYQFLNYSFSQSWAASRRSHRHSITAMNWSLMRMKNKSVGLSVCGASLPLFLVLMVTPTIHLFYFGAPTFSSQSLFPPVVYHEVCHICHFYFPCRWVSVVKSLIIDSVIISSFLNSLPLCFSHSFKQPLRGSIFSCFLRKPFPWISGT